MRTRPVRHTVSATAAAAALLCALASCSTSPAPTNAPPPGPTSALTMACADLATLRTSLQALSEVKPAEDGLTALNTAMANVKTSLKAAEGSMSEALSPSVEEVKTAFTTLQTSVGGLTADNLREKGPAIAAALTQVRTATTALSTTLTEGCPAR